MELLRKSEDVYHRIASFLKREPFLSILILIYVALLLYDPSLIRRTPELIDYESIATILSFLIVSRGLEISGFFSKVAGKVVEFSRGSELRLLVLLIAVVTLSSTVIMNDNAIFVFVPLILTISRVADIELSKAVSLVAIAANVGSALTPFGNPQNIIIWRKYDVPALKFIVSMFPFVLAWTTLNLAFAWKCARGCMDVSELPSVSVNKRLVTLSLTLFVLNVLLVEINLPLLAFLITVVTYSTLSRETILSIDFAIVAVFALIFVDFGEMSRLISPYIGVAGSNFEIVILSALLSQAISNVPATVLLSSRCPWLPLAVGVNLGGTGLVIGSLANLIAVRMSKISLKDFHKYSVPFFLAATAVTLILIA